MFLRRARLRVPTLLATLLLLVTGAADAFGVDACSRHTGTHAHGAARETASAQPALAPDPEGHAAHAHHDAAAHAAHAVQDPSDHLHHGSGASEAARTDELAALAAATAHAAAPGEDSGCDCRLLCLAGSALDTPNVVAVTFSTPAPEPALTEAISTDPVGILPQSLLPHVLPFSNAPPFVA